MTDEVLSVLNGAFYFMVLFLLGYHVGKMRVLEENTLRIVKQMMRERVKHEHEMTDMCHDYEPRDDE